MKKKDKPLIPLRDFFRNSLQTNLQISPDGCHISYLKPYKSRLNVFIQPISDDDKLGQPQRITDDTERDILSYSWVSNNTLLYAQDTAGDENYHLFCCNIDTDKVYDLTPFDGVKADFIDELEMLDNHVLISMNKRNPQFFDVYKANTQTGELSLVAENPGNIRFWKTDNEGQVRIAIATDGVNTTILHRQTEQDEFEPLIRTDFKTSFYPVLFTEDNKNIYASSNVGRDKSAFVIYDIAKKEEAELLFEHEEVDVSGFMYSKKRNKVEAYIYNTWKYHYHFVDDVFEQIIHRIEEKVAQSGLSNFEVSISSKNKEEDKLIVLISSDRVAGIYYFYDVKTDKLVLLADRKPFLSPSELSVMKPIQFQSRDGLTLNGYLTLPKNTQEEDTPLPLVVNPHGGPWWRDTWSFDPQVQFLANRGYAVLQINFRGSTGYGKVFMQASFKEWGGKMQNDITDAVHWAIDKGYADPNRIAIYGGSYGGYATLAGLAFTPDLYACGIDFVGVSNLFTFMNTIPPYWKPLLDQMYEMVGHPEHDKELLQAKSPVFHVDKIKAPLFVVQGAKDPRVNINESNQIVDALKEKGVAVKYMVKEDEGHGFLREENKFEFYEAMEAFLAKYLHKNEPILT